MKRVLTIFFVALGAIFFCLILAGVYLYVFDPFNVRPLFTGSGVESAAVGVGSVDNAASSSNSTASPEVVDTNEQLNAEQEAALQAVGINPAALPSEITSEQEACFVELFGIARVEEIKAGAAPTMTELLRGRGCLE